MTFSQLLLILRARRRIILAMLAIALIAALAVSLLLPRTYEATTTLVLNYKGIDPLTGIAMPGQMVPSYIATQVGIIRSKGVARQVAQNLHLDERADFQEKYRAATSGRAEINDWIADQLLKGLEVVPARDSNVIQIAAKAREAELAAALANAFAAAYQATSVQLKVDPVRNASRYFDEQIKALRTDLALAQERLSAFQQQNGLVSAESRDDMETLRLNELTAQLVTVQNQLMEARSRRSVSRVAGGSESPDVLASPLIQNLKAALTQAEVRFSLISERYTEAHPQYRQAQAERDKLRAELTNSMRAASGSIANSARILRQREADLSRALADQRTKVLAMNRARDQLAVLSKEVASAQHAYDAATERVAQTNLEARFNQSEAAVLNAAPVPYRHASPRLSLNLAAGMLAGMLLGIGLALLAEARDRRVRTAHDLADALQAPVFGAVDWNSERPARTLLPHWLRPRSLPSPQAS